MFFAELSKYNGIRQPPIVDMFEDLEAEAFALLLKYVEVEKLKNILDIIPQNRTDILDLVMQTDVL